MILIGNLKQLFRLVHMKMILSLLLKLSYLLITKMNRKLQILSRCLGVELSEHVKAIDAPVSVILEAMKIYAGEKLTEKKITDKAHESSLAKLVSENTKLKTEWKGVATKLTDLAQENSELKRLLNNLSK